MHRDAPSCTVMHRDGFITFWIAPNSTKLLFIALLSSYLHCDAPRCTVMHRVAPWCTKMAFFLLKKLMNCTKCHQTDLYYLFSSYLHCDAPRCTMMHWVAPWCTEMALLTSELHRIAPNWFLLLYWVPICTVMHRDAPWCTELHRDAPRWLY